MTQISRRTVVASLVGMAVAVPIAGAKPMIDLDKRALVELERKSGGRLGVCVLDTASGLTLGHRMDERFAMCSTFKLPLAAAIMQRADQGKLNLDTFVAYTKADMVPHAPVTQANLAKGGMTIRALAKPRKSKAITPPPIFCSRKSTVPPASNFSSRWAIKSRASTGSSLK